MNSNFLNAQNYILWKTEKKKLLSKFFVEKFLKIFYWILEKISNNFIYIWIILFIIDFSLIIFIFFRLLKAKDSWLINILVFLIIFWLFFVYKFIKNYSKIKLTKINIKITNFSDFFTKNKSSNTYLEILYYLIFLFNIFIIFPILLAFLFEYLAFPKSIAFILMFSFPFLGVLTIYSWVNLYSLLLFPFLSIIMFFIGIYSLIYTFIFKWINSYIFLKYKPQTKFFEKFKKLEKNLATNEFYLVEAKK